MYFAFSSCHLFSFLCVQVALQRLSASIVLVRFPARAVAVLPVSLCELGSLPFAPSSSPFTPNSFSLLLLSPLRKRIMSATKCACSTSSCREGGKLGGEEGGWGCSCFASPLLLPAFLVLPFDQPTQGHFILTLSPASLSRHRRRRRPRRSQCRYVSSRQLATRRELTLPPFHLPRALSPPVARPRRLRPPARQAGFHGRQLDQGHVRH